ncbi:uncharacterized protein LOC123880164 isoform X3 [Maniola jurtina]|uniref:uncharacterized protein LOC123880164 isoform X3 n=1 Tax=Maniola jurtina TaxID=191418 RepID=UPI001E688451|nr:uncharacterized protein LOC123880164 isoform X3 [Maniola jurtina]
MMDLFNLFAVAILLQVIPALVGASCRYPGSPAHSRVTFSDDELQEGTIASYSCEQGFELLGPSRRICDAGRWSPDGVPFCVINVAAGKAPMQISTDEGAVPQKALDGSTSSAFSAETCTLSKIERAPWWYVNLLEPYMVQLVRLDFGKPCCGMNTPATIEVRVGNNRPDLGTNPICNRFIGFLEQGQPLFLPCNPPMPGAFVSVHLEAAIPSQLSICEAFVYTDQALPIERCPQFRDQPPGSTATYNGKCYIFYDRQPASFQEALAVCQSRGGSLVVESNPALQGFISWELWRRHRSDSSSRYWIGAVRDREDPKDWRWVNSGTLIKLTFWKNLVWRENCAMFDGSKEWLWADVNCDSRLNYICQHQPKACGRPEQPPNSTMSTEHFPVGATVEYSCDEGHLLVGPTVRTCLDTGFYDEYPPLCKLVQCEQPPIIPNGRVTVSNNASVFGAIAEYTCSKGFQLRGARKIKCLDSGLWDKAVPHCDPEERRSKTTTTTTTTTTSTTKRPSTNPVLTSHAPTTPRFVLPTKPRTQRPISSTVSSEAPDLPSTRKPRPRITTTERPTNKSSEIPHTRKITVSDSQGSPTSHVPHIIVASHSRENQILDIGNNISAKQTPRKNVPPVDGERRETSGLRHNIAAVVAITAVAAIVVLIPIITTIIYIVRSRKHKKDENEKRDHRRFLTPDITIASLDSSSSESPSGLNRYYRQAWENLHEAAGSGHGQRRHGREAPKDGSELVVADVYPAAHTKEKRRHHHHHHHREPRHPDWQPHLPTLIY